MKKLNLNPGLFMQLRMDLEAMHETLEALDLGHNSREQATVRVSASLALAWAECLMGIEKQVEEARDGD